MGMEMEITCDCGYVAHGETPEKTEAETWHHALKAHLEMLQGMSVEQLEQVLASDHKNVGLAGK